MLGDDPAPGRSRVAGPFHIFSPRRADRIIGVIPSEMWKPYFVVIPSEMWKPYFVVIPSAVEGSALRTASLGFSNDGTRILNGDCVEEAGLLVAF